MKSPITDKEMSLLNELRMLTFRKESFQCKFHFYQCEDSGEKFTSTSLDEINLTQIHNQYRAKYNIPSIEEIKNIRKQYELAAIKMANILGFGVNSYRQYEAGEMPSLSNSKLILLARAPLQFKSLVTIADSLEESEKEKLLNKIDLLIKKQQNNSNLLELENYLFGSKLADEYSGYRVPDIERVKQIVLFFAEKLQPWKTQLNKLLFYTDFLCFKRSCFSMSGLRYRAIQLGPVPSNYHSIYEYFVNKGYVNIKKTEYSNEKSGEQFQAGSGISFNADLFNDIEIEILNQIVNRFKNVKASKIADISHEEKAWIDNESSKSLISYQYAFDLKEI